MEEEFGSSLSDFLRANAVVIFLGLLGLGFIAYGLFTVFGNQTNEPDFVVEEGEAEAESEVKGIMIDVSGAVERPGVYELLGEQRVQDALIEAGGMSREADRVWVVKNLNLAAKLSDGAKLYVPFEGENVSAAASEGGIDGSVSGSGLININTAGESELDTLPGIGPVTAQKIIDNRPYSDTNELLEKKAVGNATFEKIKDMISVY